MGTSSIFSGNNDRNPLLPDDYDEGNNEQSTPVTWQTVKTNMSKYIKSSGGHGTARNIVQQYVKASGGSKRMMPSASSGIRTAGNIGAFFHNVNSTGISVTLHNLGIEFEGRDVTEVFSRLVDVMSPGANTKEDSAARKAAQEALSGLYDYVEQNNMEIECLDHIPINLMDKALCNYISTYIWAMMMKDLGSRFEQYMDNPQNAYTMEREFKDVIMGVVQVEYEKNGSIINQDVKSAINNLSKRCLKVLEGVV